jgi:hypothetical protein
MNRRTLLKNAIIVGGGILFMPACGPSEEKKKASAWKHLSLTAAEEALVGEMVETLIPATDTPGAKALEIDRFVIMMVDDCYPKDQQAGFVKGLQQSSEVAEKLFHRSFDKCSTEEKIKVLQALPAHTAETGQFYNLLRELTREGYLKSKFVMTKLLPYELVPGRYNGYVLLKQQTA